jgi:hypothetical protein
VRSAHRPVLAALHPDAWVLGDWTGSLSNGGEQIVLIDALGNPADQVRYADGGRWPTAADGGGSSLELIDPWADNGAPGAWAASDESDAAPWTTLRWTAEAAPSAVGPDGVWNELIIGLLDAGEVLIDDVSVVEDPDGEALQLVRDPGFDGAADWRTIGNHRRSARVPDPEAPADTVGACERRDGGTAAGRPIFVGATAMRSGRLTSSRLPDTSTTTVWRGSAFSGETIRIKPTPQLKVRRISWSLMPPVSASHWKTWGMGQASQSNAAFSPSAMHRGGFSIRPPPVICASALIPSVALRAARSGFT